MSLLAAAFPAQAVIPAAETVILSFAPAARLLIGLSAVAAFFMIFKPLLTGLAHAALLAVKSRRFGDRSLRDAIMLHRMARDVEASQPSLAAELRGFASRA